MQRNEHEFINGVESKRCSADGSVVPITSFHNNKKSRDGLESQCKDCAKKWRQSHPEPIKIKKPKPNPFGISNMQQLVEEV